VSAALPVNAMHFLEWRKSMRSFQGMALVDDLVVNLTSAGEPQRLRAGRVSASLFPMLGLRTQIGRTFLESEDREGHDRVVVLSDPLWRRLFSSSPDVLGKKLLLDGVPYEVIGVLPANAWVPDPAQLFTLPVSTGTAELWKPMAIRDDELTPMGDF